MGRTNVALRLEPDRQRTLLDLAAIDGTISTATHRRATLPALRLIATNGAEAAQLRRQVIEADTEVSDLQRATARLDAEVEQVRARSARDATLLGSGSANPKDLENLQLEIESLKRRQSVLEDEELELMEQRENAESAVQTLRQRLTDLEAQVSEAENERDREFGVLDGQLTADRAARAELVGGLPSDVLALYTRIHDSGKIAAGKLLGSRCSACRLEIDRTALAEIRSAPDDAIVRCTECGAILVRA